MMQKAFRDPTYQHFSAFVLGSSAMLVGYLGLALGMAFNFPVANWLWFLGLPIVVVGFLLDTISRRLLWIRMYQVTTFLLCLISNVRFIGLTITANYQLQRDWPTLAIAILICCVTGGAFWQTMNNPRRSFMPHGSVGGLDNATGFVEPDQSPPQVKGKWEETKSGVATVMRLTPLISGAAMVLVQTMSASGKLSLLPILLTLFVLFIAYGVGSYAAYAICINRWEVRYQRKMYVKC